MAILLFPKFIIEDNCLIMSRVSLHEHLAINKKLVKGGGWYDYDAETKTYTFKGKSIEFGAATVEDIRKCIENKSVYTNKYKSHNISDGFKFKYDGGNVFYNEIIDL